MVKYSTSKFSPEYALNILICNETRGKISFIEKIQSLDSEIITHRLFDPFQEKEPVKHSLNCVATNCCEMH